METQASPQLQAVGEEPDKPTYASQLLHQQNSQTKTKLKPVQYIHGEPTIQFTFKELEHFTIEEGLHQAIVMKFSFGAPPVKDLRSLIPKQLAIKGRCLIGSLANRHLLLRFDLNEDYVGVLSKQVGFIQFNGEQHQFRTFPWTQWFDPKEETSKALVWVSFPELPPNMFAKVPLLSIASVVGKPIAIDRATQDRTRPSTARVKVITDILDKHPKRIRLHYLDEASGKLIEHYQEVVFDNLPLYCIACKHQGHEDDTCRVLGRKYRTDHDETALRGNVQIEKYQGDARELINNKRRAGSNRQDERAALNTIIAGTARNSGQKTDDAHSAGVSSIGVNVRSQKGNDQKQSMGETATVTSGNDQPTNFVTDGDQLIAKVAITDPKQSVSNVQALDVNVAMEMGCKTVNRLGEQIVTGTGNGTTVGIDQNYIVDVVSASTNDCVVGMDGQTTVKEQNAVIKTTRNSGLQNQFPMGQEGNRIKNGNHGNSQGLESALQNKKGRGNDKGKAVMVYKEKRSTTPPGSKPTGIRICEPICHSSITHTESLPLRNAESPKVANAEINESIIHSTDVNSLQQNVNAAADTPRNDIVPDGSGTTGWTVVTKRKNRKYNLIAGNDTSVIEQHTDAGNETNIFKQHTDAVNTGDQLTAEVAITGPTFAEESPGEHNGDPIEREQSVLAQETQTDDAQQMDPQDAFPISANASECYDHKVAISEESEGNKIVLETVNQIQTEAIVESSPLDSNQQRTNENTGKDGRDQAIILNDSERLKVNVASDIMKQIVFSAPNEIQNNTPVDGATESNTLQGKNTKVDNAEARDQESETPGQMVVTANTEPPHHTNMESTKSDQDTSSQTSSYSFGGSGNSSTGNSRHQVGDIKLMNNVVTGGQHHSSSNWAVLVEEEDDNIGFLDSLFSEDTNENRSTDIIEMEQKTASKGLSPNAPVFVPRKLTDGNQLVGGKFQQLNTKHQATTTGVVKKQATDRELLDALVNVNPLAMKNTHDNSVYRVQDMEVFDSDEEDYILDEYYNNAVREAGVSPRHQRSGKIKPHAGNRRGDDENFVPRLLPMRQAKQKGAGPSTSTKSNKSKKK